MENKQIFIGSNVSTEQIADSVRVSLSDKEMCSLAISFGENGDGSYELLLLEEIAKLLLEIYPPQEIESEEEQNLKQLMIKLKEILPLIKKENKL